MIWLLRMGLEFTTAKTLQHICMHYANVLENILTYIKCKVCNLWYNPLHGGISRWMLVKFFFENVYGKYLYN